MGSKVKNELGSTHNHMHTTKAPVELYHPKELGRQATLAP